MSISFDSDMLKEGLNYTIYIVHGSVVLYSNRYDPTIFHKSTYTAIPLLL